MTTWREVNRYNVVDGDGNIEEMVLERNDKGTFRIRNDFGNINIEFDTMSAVEFFRKTFADVQDEIENDLNDIWNDDETEEESDCDGQFI